MSCDCGCKDCDKMSEIRELVGFLINDLYESPNNSELYKTVFTLVLELEDRKLKDRIDNVYLQMENAM